MKFTSMVLVAILVPVTTMAADSLQVEPGKWETTTIMHNPFMPKPQQSTEIACLKDAEFDPRVDLQAGMKEMKCKTLNYEASATQLTWKVRCANPADPSTSIEGEGVWHSKGDSGSGSLIMKMTLPGMGLQEFRTEMSSRRLGKCD